MFYSNIISWLRTHSSIRSQNQYVNGCKMGLTGVCSTTAIEIHSDVILVYIFSMHMLCVQWKTQQLFFSDQARRHILNGGLWSNQMALHNGSTWQHMQLDNLPIFSRSHQSPAMLWPQWYRYHPLPHPTVESRPVEGVEDLIPVQLYYSIDSLCTCRPKPTHLYIYTYFFLITFFFYLNNVNDSGKMTKWGNFYENLSAKILKVVNGFHKFDLDKIWIGQA